MEMRILAVISGEYGARHVRNIRDFGPSEWAIQTWQAPAVFPLVIDYPEDFLPASLPQADLLLSFAEHKGVAELVPEIVQMTGAKAVIASIDNEAWLPRGLARQLRGWLERMNVVCVTPKPLCSLTERDYGLTRRERIAYDDPWISAFASYFGQPDLAILVDPVTRQVSAVDVRRDAVCGCARFVAHNLVGVSVDDVEEKAGLLHHHYPCLASMGKDSDFGDTLMHVSGNVLKENISAQVKPFRQYITPGSASDLLAE